MSATAIFSISGPNYCFTSRGDYRVFFFDHSLLTSPRSSSPVFFRYPYGTHKKTRTSSSIFKPFSPVMEWQDCTVKMDVDVPISVAYNCYSDREAIPGWMPFISSVKILEDKPDLSQWSLKYKAFGRDIEFSWLARNMQPIPNQKIHWRSLDGLPNSYRCIANYTSFLVLPLNTASSPRKKGEQGLPELEYQGLAGFMSLACRQHVQSSEHLACEGRFEAKSHIAFTPPPLHSTNATNTSTPLQPPPSSLHLYHQHTTNAALQPFLESLLVRGLERFANFAKSYSSDSTS
ncbi:polyketide cyclase/dehydrase and lipid transport superfamily protein [Actinidia rufa]|uniref:Polyketide cyclase/dehydrase and lipid transport superfamily protein n=1 Tax=Actinidia rufa TaxID=165716 RepID=A0A7J0G0L6_9ERIC|nr:polyketide cyclase/dehydrase and lipid transport superfamily protein [Actinidia rufa]